MSMSTVSDDCLDELASAKSNSCKRGYPSSSTGACSGEQIAGKELLFYLFTLLHLQSHGNQVTFSLVKLLISKGLQRQMLLSQWLEFQFYLQCI